ncbi:MAG: hypothetical protein ABFD50_02270 [Smithella sp.]
MSTDTTSLRIKYPTASYDPDPDCPYCHGIGERKVHLSAGEFIQESDVITPCICIFVEHDFAKKIGPVIGKWAGDMLREMKNENDEEGNRDKNDIL